MRFAYSLAGNAPVIKKYQIGETLNAGIVGIPMEYPTLSDTDGLLMCETNSCVDALGVSLDNPGTRQTAQQSDNTDPARLVSVIVNPCAVYRARLSGSSTSGTALTPLTNTVASATGLLTTLALGTAYDDGVIWGYTGANAGILRKVTAVGGTNETPIVAFPFDIAVGDTFLPCTFGPGEDAGFNLTSDLDEVDASADSQSVDNFRCLDFFQKDAADRGNLESYVELMLIDQVFGGNIT
jgi:hypothetical protein